MNSISSDGESAENPIQLTHSKDKVKFIKEFALSLIPFLSTYRAYKQEGGESAINHGVADAALLVPIIGVPVKVGMALKSAMKKSQDEFTVSQEVILKFVNAFLNITDKAWHQQYAKNPEMFYDAVARRNYNRSILKYLLKESNILSDRCFLDKMSGAFGAHLRGVTDFMAEKAGANSDDEVLISTAYKFTAALDDIIITLRDIHGEIQSELDTPQYLSDISQLTNEEIKVIAMLGIERVILE
ncbi:hypothetical protein V1599_20790 [Enterobacter sp. ECC-175]|nr:hypothetical protein DBY73_003805 [Enterobacter sp. RIT 418]